MQAILTDISKPFKTSISHGDITLLQAKFWPGWVHPRDGHLLKYQLTGATRVYSVPIQMGKVYNFKDFEAVLDQTFNVKGQPRNVDFYLNERINLNIGGNVASITLTDSLVKLFKLPQRKNNTFTGNNYGEPVKAIQITFNDTDILMLTCSEIDSTTHLNNAETKALYIMPITTSMDGSITPNLATPARGVFRNNYLKELHFKTQDPHGNALPLKKVFMRLLINDRECIFTQNVPNNTTDCPAK